MDTLVTTSGFMITPPSGLYFNTKKIQFHPTAIAAGTGIRISGHLGTINTFFAVGGTLVPASLEYDLDINFKYTENITITPTNGTAVLNYITIGEQAAFNYYQAAAAYSDAPIVQRWPTVVQSGSYTRGFGG